MQNMLGGGGAGGDAAGMEELLKGMDPSALGLDGLGGTGQGPPEGMPDFSNMSQEEAAAMSSQAMESVSGL